MNVTTRIHRDRGDQDICLILVLSDCKGGDLCLMEPGLVLQLDHGDIVIFPSADISHFNLHYQGKRASVVFHSDRAGANWVKDRNGWKENSSMHTTSINNS